LQSSEQLDVLNLAHNSIATLEENVFLELKTLNSIDFESNRIATIDPNAFNGIQGKVRAITAQLIRIEICSSESLEWLKLGENQLKEIPCSALQNLSKLRELDLRGNLIEVVHKDSFHQFGANIKFLHLQKNRRAECNRRRERLISCLLQNCPHREWRFRASPLTQVAVFTKQQSAARSRRALCATHGTHCYS